MENAITSALRVFVLGSPGSGKTTVISSIVGGSDAESPNRGEVLVSFWEAASEDIQDENELKRNGLGPVVEFWDLPGVKLYRSLHSIFYTKSTLYVIVVSADCDSPEAEVVEIWKDIILKIPEAGIVILLSKIDEKDDKSNATLDTLKANIQNRLRLEYENVFKSKGGNNNTIVSPALLHSICNAKNQQIEEENQSVVILPFSSSQSNNVRVLTHLITKLSVKAVEETKGSCVDRTPELSKCLELIGQKRKENIVLVKYSVFATFEIFGGNIENCIACLQEKGTILDLYVHLEANESRYICIDPARFANILANSHLDNTGRTFRIEAMKFWPKEGDVDPPNPSDLIKLFQDIHTKGLVLEPLFPLLWNTPFMRKDQTEMIFMQMQSLGVSLVHENVTYVSQEINLNLPYFRFLSMEKQHYLTAMDKLQNKKPALHWTSFLLKGDVQISVCCCHVKGLPQYAQSRIPVICNNAYAGFPHYFYIWRNGILIRLQEVSIYIETTAKHTEITARVNSDFFPDLTSVSQVLWVTVAPCLTTLLYFFHSWPGIQLEIEISLKGDMNNGETSRKEQRYKFVQLLSRSLKQLDTNGAALLLPFEIDTSVSDMKTWLELVISKRKDVLQQYLPEALNSKQINQASDTPPLNTTKSTEKKNLKVHWDFNNVKSDTEDASIQLPLIRVDGASDDNDTEHKEQKMKDKKERKKTEPGQKSRVSGDKSNTKGSQRNKSKIANETEDTGSKDNETVFNESAALKMASTFVTAILAAGVVAFMEEQNEETSGQWSQSQMSVAKNTANLTMSTWTGDLGSASKAITDVTSQPKVPAQTTVTKHGPSESKVCCIL